MGRKKRLINKTDVPQYAVERFARCVFDDVWAAYADQEVQAEFAQWLAEREQHKKTRAAKTATLVSVMWFWGNKQIIRTRKCGSDYSSLVRRKGLGCTSAPKGRYKCSHQFLNWWQQYATGILRFDYSSPFLCAA